MTKKVLIKTYGCQMNVYDSSRMRDVLAPLGFEETSEVSEADMVILNTCHIREKAAEKIYSELGKLREMRDIRRETGKSVVFVTHSIPEAVYLSDRVVVMSNRFDELQGKAPPLGQKGARITSHISLPGRYVVYMPTTDHIGVSRRIEDEKRRQEEEEQRRLEEEARRATQDIGDHRCGHVVGAHGPERSGRRPADGGPGGGDDYGVVHEKSPSKSSRASPTSVACPSKRWSARSISTSSFGSAMRA